MWDWKYCILELKGSFLINVGIRNRGFFVQPLFVVRMAKKNSHILEMLRREFKIGRIVVKGNFAEYIVRGINECWIFAGQLDENSFLTEKKRDFVIWKGALERIKKMEHLEKEGFLAICELRDQLNLGRKSKNYKNKNYFERIIERNKTLEKNLEKSRKIAESLRKTLILKNLSKQ